MLRDIRTRVDEDYLESSDICGTGLVHRFAFFSVFSEGEVASSVVREPKQ
jgi:hypothetical protein